LQRTALVPERSNVTSPNAEENPHANLATKPHRPNNAFSNRGPPSPNSVLSAPSC
jgi:hypothetical protein